MTLRLVLVSLVAALGLTIPGAPMIESWVASTQNWMNARFADWDTRNPQDADFVIVSDYYDAGQFASRPTVLKPSRRPRGSVNHQHGAVRGPRGKCNVDPIEQAGRSAGCPSQPSFVPFLSPAKLLRSSRSRSRRESGLALRSG